MQPHNPSIIFKWLKEEISIGMLESTTKRQHTKWYPQLLLLLLILWTVAEGKVPPRWMCRVGKSNVTGPDKTSESNESFRKRERELKGTPTEKSLSVLLRLSPPQPDPRSDLVMSAPLHLLVHLIPPLVLLLLLHFVIRIICNSPGKIFWNGFASPKMSYSISIFDLSLWSQQHNN